MTLIEGLTASMPALAVFLFLVILRMPATRAMPLALLIAAGMAWLIFLIQKTGNMWSKLCQFHDDFMALFKF